MIERPTMGFGAAAHLTTRSELREWGQEVPLPNFVRIAGDLTAGVPLYACTRRHAYLRTRLQGFRAAMRDGHASAYQLATAPGIRRVSGAGGMKRWSSPTFTVGAAPFK